LNTRSRIPGARAGLEGQAVGAGAVGAERSWTVRMELENRNGPALPGLARGVPAAKNGLVDSSSQ